MRCQLQCQASAETVLRGITVQYNSHHLFRIKMRNKILQDVLWNQKTKAVSLQRHAFLHKQNNYLYLQVSRVSLVIVFVCLWKEGRADQRSQGHSLNKHQDYGSKSRAVGRKEKEWEILAELIKRQLWQKKSALNPSCAWGYGTLHIPC